MKNIIRFILVLIFGGGTVSILYFFTSENNINVQQQAVIVDQISKEPNEQEEIGIIKEGACFYSVNLPDVIIKINQVGESSVSLYTNLTGSILTQYSKSQLEEELSNGISKGISCSQFDILNKQHGHAKVRKKQNSYDLFGIKLSEQFDSFNTNYSKNILSCKDEGYRTHNYQLNTYSDYSVPIKKCVTKDEVEIIFAELNNEGTFNLAKLEKDLTKQKVTLGVLLKKLELKTGEPLHEFVPSEHIYEFSGGYISIEFESGDYKKNSDSKITVLKWWRNPTLDELVDKITQINTDKRKTQINKENEKKAKELDI